jgi:hypothetical protein
MGQCVIQGGAFRKGGLFGGFATLTPIDNNVGTKHLCHLIVIFKMKDWQMLRPYGHSTVA